MSDKLSDESLPCPFCGCTDISEGEVLTDNPDGGASTQSMCRGCGALGPDAHLREGEVDFGSVKSTAAWNRRASRAPAITMPPLNDAMRAVLTNENCIYGTPDELYAALVKAAPAISESDLLTLLPGTTYMDEPDGGSPSLLEQLQRMAKDAARYRWLQRQRAKVWREIADMPINRTNEYIDAARDGGGS
ncbi:Lar family restriction alleviation protein [Burkholderia gladioli]|uniref:Lar family restriction alleviation protein n=1 Tax=Burkholderia gladioli TaxID=28095 RepID=UPI00164180E8|nr:Lar family restriction alleviation protein [Burkholderia gladioli]